MGNSLINHGKYYEPIKFFDLENFLIFGKIFDFCKIIFNQYFTFFGISKLKIFVLEEIFLIFEKIFDFL